jgi:nucleoid-associated protein YgaU
MGKLEKVIVLSVLFVIAVVLVVSLTTDNPIDKQNVSVLGQPVPKLPKTEPAPKPDAGALGAGQTPAPGMMLNANVTPGGAQPANAPAPLVPTSVPVPAPVAALPTGSILVTTDGLAESYLPDMRFYTWQPNDTYRGIAATYYGDWSKLTLLRRANEGRKNVQPGEKILVPVFDLDAVPGVAVEPIKPAAGAGANKAGTKLAGAEPKAEPTTPPAGSGKVHVVKEGESLWKIAKAELGSGAQWEKIYNANRDVMKTPEALKTGMKLKIP